MNNFY